MKLIPRETRVRKVLNAAYEILSTVLCHELKEIGRAIILCGKPYRVPGYPMHHFVYYESIKRELKTIGKTRPIYDCRCDERLIPKDDEYTCLGYTGLLEELE